MLRSKSQVRIGDGLRVFKVAEDGAQAYAEAVSSLSWRSAISRVATVSATSSLVKMGTRNGEKAQHMLLGRQAHSNALGPLQRTNPLAECDWWSISQARRSQLLNGQRINSCNP